MEGPRGCVPGEIGAVVALANRIFVRAGAGMGRKFPTLFSAENGEWLRTFWDGDEPVSLVGVWRAEVLSSFGPLRVAHVGAVGTLPEFRGRGLATALLEDAFRRLHAEGTSLVFISGGRGLYLRLGARRFGRLWRYRALKGQVPGPGQDLWAGIVERLTEDELSAVRRLYAGEPVHYLRREDQWRSLLPAKGYLPPEGGRGLCVVRRAGRIVAYLLHGSPRRTEAPGSPVRLAVDEFAGERAAVAAALPRLLEESGAEELDLLVQRSDQEMHALLGALGLVRVAATYSGTVRLLNVGVFLDVAGRVRPDLLRLRHAAAFDTAEGAEEAAIMTGAAFGGGEDAGAEETDGLPLMEVPRPDGLQFI